MSWEIVTKAEAAKLAGARESDMRDEWYDMAIGAIERMTGVKNLGSTANVTETSNGDGTGLLLVRQPPIVSVTSLTNNGIAVDPDNYVVYTSFVEIDPSSGGIDRFDKGVGNVVIQYVSGTNGDQATKLAAVLIIKELASMSLGEGAESKIQFYKPGQSAATEEPLRQWGIHGKIAGIIKTLLGVKMRVR